MAPRHAGVPDTRGGTTVLHISGLVVEASR